MKKILLLLALASTVGASILSLSCHRLENLHFEKHFPVLVKPKKNVVNWWEKMQQGVEHFEGFKPQPYRCPAGVLTVGFGHTGKHASKRLTKSQAKNLLTKELLDVRSIVRNNVKVSLSPWQEAALVSFTFNAGEGNLKKLINGQDRLNGGNYKSIEYLLPKYHKGGGKVLDGLVRRRAWEVELWRGTVRVK